MPTRYLKAGIRDSESIDNLSPQAENLFYRLLVTVDDFGRFDARPAMIKANCFPIKDAMTINKCKDLLEELANKNLVIVYEAFGKNVLQMSKWDNIPRAKESKYPSLADAGIQVHTDVYKLHTDVPLTVTVTETETKTKTETKTPPDGVSQLVWDSFVKQRKTKRAQVTELVIQGIQEEADLAGWSLEKALNEVVVRNWQSFKADWVDKPVNKADQVFTTVPSRFERDPALIDVENRLKQGVPMPPEIRLAMERLRK
jgi:hypothetical protein